VRKLKLVDLKQEVWIVYTEIFSSVDY